MVKYSCLFDKHRHIYNGIQLSESITEEGNNLNNIHEIELHNDDFKSLEIAIEHMAFFDTKENNLYFGYYESTRSSNAIVVFIATHKYVNNAIVDIEDIFIEESRII